MNMKELTKLSNLLIGQKVMYRGTLVLITQISPDFCFGGGCSEFNNDCNACKLHVINKGQEIRCSVGFVDLDTGRSNSWTGNSIADFKSVFDIDKFGGVTYV